MLDLIRKLVDFIVHIDRHLAEIIASYGLWTYAVLWLIIFAETGLVVTPFLPGDSLLFAAGTFCAKPETGLNVHLMAVLLWVATLAASALDGVGGIPFLRSVRVHERAEMSGVYRTYLDFSDLLPNVIFSIALLMMPISGVFIILAVWLVLAGWVSWRYLPRSM